jgi:hypothetical protein
MVKIIPAVPYIAGLILATEFASLCRTPTGGFHEEKA